MRYIHLHIAHIIDRYDGSLPLAHFLKNYFKNNPKLGSRDRKVLSEMAYSFYRFSKGLDNNLNLEQQLQACLFLSENTQPYIAPFLPQQWQTKAVSFEQRMMQLREAGISFSLKKTTNIHSELSVGISREEWLQSMMLQPRLFIRIRKNKKGILTTLQANGLAFEELSANCISLPNTAPIDKLLQAEDYVIQDVSSQQTSDYFLPKPHEKWWDCCSGAGGKSLLLKDFEPSVQLTVSDVRTSILRNLSQRFETYHHRQPEKIVVDAAQAAMLASALRQQQFDNILCDVPCTGSGTWARTPEQLYFFKETTIADFAQRQRLIAGNAVHYLKPDGRLIYITCSVFYEENENVVEHLLQQTNLSLHSMNLINGIAAKADSMFIAVLKKT